ncbi:hypothetical protein EX30DRAFT_129667 [Ascodesmis nigricans]|uniref:Uncharacterized protein n=1 Tax=Ascodesmis nigricans TaxID=341454 RepID=A0A4S2MSG0_9PEZI|nr:hypothetical protein EX30DRAFT_129667 [Ascodesmis nigricans]
MALLIVGRDGPLVVGATQRARDGLFDGGCVIAGDPPYGLSPATRCSRLVSSRLAATTITHPPLFAATALCCVNHIPPPLRSASNTAAAAPYHLPARLQNIPSSELEFGRRCDCCDSTRRLARSRPADARAVNNARSSATTALKHRQSEHTHQLHHHRNSELCCCCGCGC